MVSNQLGYRCHYLPYLTTFIKCLSYSIFQTYFAFLFSNIFKYTVNKKIPQFRVNENVSWLATPIVLIYIFTKTIIIAEISYINYLLTYEKWSPGSFFPKHYGFDSFSLHTTASLIFLRVYSNNSTVRDSSKCNGGRLTYYGVNVCVLRVRVTYYGCFNYCSMKLCPPFF